MQMQKQMRGFFASLRMTTRGGATADSPASLPNDKQKEQATTMATTTAGAVGG
jgi:hypothetical protein